MQRRPAANARDSPADGCLNDVALSVLAAGLVGYTMRDIRYKWNSGSKSVGISKEVELPQFRVLGHRQRATVINLSTGNHRTAPHHPILFITTYMSLSVTYVYYSLRDRV